jgi:tetratricopeptide (TPR) repeat protein
MPSLDKKILGLIGGILTVLLVVVGLRYSAEVRKNRLLLAENQKTVASVEEEVQKLQKTLSETRERNIIDSKKISSQFEQCLKERSGVSTELEATKKLLENERNGVEVANVSASKLRDEVIRLERKNQEDVADVEKSLKKKVRNYEARILSLEAALEKAQKKLKNEAERYHYNLGVIYSQQKEFDSAVTEFRTVLGYNPKNAQAHYNLGIIYDDYFKDKKNASVHYHSFLDLGPKPEDAEAVREWLINLDK